MDNYDHQINRAAVIRHAVGPFAHAILVKTPQGTYAVPVEDLYVGSLLRHHGQWKDNELSLLRHLVDRKTRTLVVGAHIGTLAIPLAKICAHVTAIEANPKTFELLQLNVLLNGLYNCRVINKAASNRVEVLEFVLSRINTAGSKRAPIKRERDYYYDNPEVVGVEAAPLDDLLKGEEYDLIVMDIEGSEYFALQGMQRILASAHALQIEFMPHHLKNVAGVSAAEFVAPITQHFFSMCVPTKRAVVPREKFAQVLSEMLNRNEAEEGLVFLKSPPDRVVNFFGA